MRTVTLFLSVFMITGCAKGFESAVPRVSPDLKLSTIEGQCLNLERVAAQMNQRGFSYPGKVYTREFKILDAISNQNFENSLYANSWRDERTQVAGMPSLRGLQQKDCASVSIPDFDSTITVYKITSASPNHLDLEIDRSVNEENLKDLPEVPRDSILESPVASHLRIEVVSTNEIIVTTRYKTVPMICVEDRSYLVQETRVYSWAGSMSHPASDAARVEIGYWNKLSALIGLPPGFTEDSSLLYVDSGVSQMMTESLQARPHELCL